jgi:uncharacterized damage-inducible protein DinB
MTTAGQERPSLIAADRLQAAVDDLATRLAALPEATFTRRPAPEEWTAAEVVGHMTEMMPYWARAALTVVRDPAQPFGRALDDPDRVGAVAAANTVPRAEALARMRSAAATAAAAIRDMDAAAWTTTGRHYARGETTVAALIETLVVEHAEGHCRQAVAAAGG